MARNATTKFWSRDELLIVLGLYFKTAFGKMHSRNPQVIEIANIINRTPNSVAIRLVNFASVDPFHQNRGIKGLSGGRKHCEIIFNEFINNREELLFETELILANQQHTTIEKKFESIFDKFDLNKQGEDRTRAVKTRVNQHLFRQIVLTNYRGQCAISGIDIPELLVAGHIVPWSENSLERLNPENGICFANIYEKAFDNGYLGVNLDYKIVLSNDLKTKAASHYYHDLFGKYEGKSINLPEKYLPKITFLNYHLDAIFKK